MSQYAARTEVGSEKSRAEIERTLTRYGATHFAYMTAPGQAVVAFRYGARQVRFVIPLPDRAAAEFTRTPTGKVATATAAESKYEQAIRQRWRALALVVKAKLEAVESGIASFEEEFFAYTVLPSGRTVFEDVGAAVDAAIDTGMPTRLMLGGAE